jgi:multidrug efflux system membrane fusion protein
MRSRSLSLGLLVVMIGLAAGCGRKPLLPSTSTGTPVVSVSKPVAREVTDYVDFTGRTEAKYTWEARPRVTGYLVGMPYKEGAEVKKGEVLVLIDDRPYPGQPRDPG